MIRLALRLSGLALVLVYAVLFTGCERQAVSTDYFPMRDGNRWEYRLLDRARLQALADGKEVPTADAIADQPAEARGDEPAAEPKAEVLGEEAKPAAKVAPARRIALALKESVDELTFRATYDGFEQVWSKRGGYVGSQNAAGRQYLLILPPHTRYRWIVTDDRGSNLYYEIEGHRDVQTPAGAFKQCAVSRQESRDRREVTRYWFAPNVGLVRRSKYYLDEEIFRQELVTYDVRASLPAGRMAEEHEIALALKGKNRGTEHLAPGVKTLNYGEETEKK
ncbi:MAG: hypothetical protein KIS92_11070 [Planctomycetota bacterium]|nr:hypothetical protein [Planctomycetota bacterium]